MLVCCILFFVMAVNANTSSSTSIPVGVSTTWTVGTVGTVGTVVPTTRFKKRLEPTTPPGDDTEGGIKINISTIINVAIVYAIISIIASICYVVIINTPSTKKIIDDVIKTNGVCVIYIVNVLFVLFMYPGGYVLDKLYKAHLSYVNNTHKVEKVQTFSSDLESNICTICYEIQGVLNYPCTTKDCKKIICNKCWDTWSTNWKKIEMPESDIFYDNCPFCRQNQNIVSDKTLSV